MARKNIYENSVNVNSQLLDWEFTFKDELELLPEEGEYGGVIKTYNAYDTYVDVFIEPYSLDDPESRYRSVLLRLYYDISSRKSITAKFVDFTDVKNLGDIDDLLETEIGIDVVFSDKTDENGEHYRNISGFFEIEEEED